MARLDEIFEIKNGLASSQVSLLKQPTYSSIPYIRPAKSQQRTIAGWVERTSVPAAHRHAKHSLFISTNGEGSHTYAYVSDFEFVANSDVSVLIPKREMGLAEKIFYAKAITLNREKFSYGRKPKGERLRSIQLPDAAPQWVTDDRVKAVSFGFGFGFGFDSDKTIKEPQIRKALQKSVRLEELFDVKYGTNLELNHLAKKQNGINFVARTSQNNGVSARVQRLCNVEPIDGMVLTVAGGGSVLETFLQLEPFYSGRDLYFLKPKVKMTVDEMLYYATCIRANQYKYSYGRQANKTLRDLKIPAFECIPTWVNGALCRITEQIEHLASNLA